MINRIGQLFITGFDTEIPSPEFLEFVKLENIGGVIFFAENCEPHSLAEESIKEILSVSEIVPFIGVDQEGGRVCRIKGLPAEYGAASEYGKSGNIELYVEQFSRAAHYIHSLGFNLLFGPVADLAINPDNRCLEGRTFGKTPAKVIPFIEKSVRIANRVGLISCLKHYPGFGAAKEDPHVKITSADYNYQTFLNRESLSFKAGIAAGADMLMTTHMRLPEIDELPVTISTEIVQKLLREALDFDGIAITDDLLMMGAESFGDYGERALRAFQAGHDLLLFGRDFRAAREAIGYFKEAYRQGLIDDSRLESSLDRISGIKSKLIVPAI
jgi:beta-N-acetylhexosaminidase